MHKTDDHQYWYRGRLSTLRSNARSIKRALIIAGCWLLLCVPADSIVGGVPFADQTLARHTVILLNKRGMCSGAVLAQDLVLTAAHCTVNLGKSLRIAGKPIIDVTGIAAHPQYTPKMLSAPDLALLKLSRPLPPQLAPVFLNTQPVAAGESLFIVGYGNGEKDEKKVYSTPRMAMLAVSERSAGLLTLIDPDHSGLVMADRGGKIGGCDGDSGAPAFTIRAGVAALAGVLVASKRDCGGITYVIPTATYLGWIRETARNWDAVIDFR
jgi:hypothetical protein